MEQSTANILGTIFWISFVVIVIALIIRKKLRSKKKTTNNEFYDACPIPPVSRVNWNTVNMGFGDEDVNESIQNVVTRFDEDIARSKEAMANTLIKVTTLQKNIFDKMKSYYEIGKGLENKERLLRSHLYALNNVKPVLGNRGEDHGKSN